MNVSLTIVRGPGMPISSGCGIISLALIKNNKALNGTGDFALGDTKLSRRIIKNWPQFCPQPAQSVLTGVHSK
jgi:hypothetical protein